MVNTGPMIANNAMTMPFSTQLQESSSSPPSSSPGGPLSSGHISSDIRIPGGRCAICLEAMKPGGQAGQALFTAECSHTFHFPCIASNVRHGNQFCPICRAPWKDLPWQAGMELLGSPRERNWSSRWTRGHTWRSADVGGLHEYSHFVEEQRRMRNSFPPQYSGENGGLYPDEPECYNDDEPLNLNLSPTPLLSEGRASGRGFCDQDVCVTISPEVSAVPACESRQCFTTLVHLKAPGARTSNSSAQALTPSADFGSCAPLDLVAVLDVSESMGGRKLMLLKQAMSFVVHNLSAADRLAVVVFSSTAQRIFPLRKMDEDGQRQALQALFGLEVTGGTNIAEGLHKGVKVLEDRREKNPVSSIMLLSDGHDTSTAGISRWQPLSRRTRGMPDSPPQAIGGLSASVESRQIPIHTFGFGSDHDAATMHSISEVSGGTFSYIEAEEVVQDAFAQCIGGLLSVVAQDVQITVICLASGVQITGIHSGSYDSDILDDARRGTIKLGHLYAEEERDFLVDLRLPAVTIASGGNESRMPLVQAACSYKDPMTQEVIQNAAEELHLMRPVALEEGQEVVSLEVDRQRNRLRSTEAIANARSLADQGNIEAALCGLRDTRVKIRASRSAQVGDPLCSVLESEFEEIQQRMANSQVYRRSGQSYVLSAQSSHSMQRANTRGDSPYSSKDAYRTPSMAGMIASSHTQQRSQRSAGSRDSAASTPGPSPPNNMSQR